MPSRLTNSFAPSVIFVPAVSSGAATCRKGSRKPSCPRSGCRSKRRAVRLPQPSGSLNVRVENFPCVSHAPAAPRPSFLKNQASSARRAFAGIYARPQAFSPRPAQRSPSGAPRYAPAGRSPRAESGLTRAAARAAARQHDARLEQVCRKLRRRALQTLCTASNTVLSGSISASRTSSAVTVMSAAGRPPRSPARRLIETLRSFQAGTPSRCAQLDLLRRALADHDAVLFSGARRSLRRTYRPPRAPIRTQPGRRRR